jgi:hypothetical protein
MFRYRVNRILVIVTAELEILNKMFLSLSSSPIGRTCGKININRRLRII